jgi:hypothetical protein
MAKLNFDARTHEPRSSADHIPAVYSTLGADRRIAVRERYIELQNGRCCHCFALLAGEPAAAVLAKKVNWRRFPRGAKFLTHPIHLHHDHKTDLTIGAVHAYCNAVLWQYHGE